MKHPLRRLLAASFAIATLTVAHAARADFDIVITSGGQSVSTIIDEGPGDSNTGTINNISVSGQDLVNLNQALQTIAPGLTFTSLGATNNSDQGTPNGIATLDVTGAVQGVGSVEILVSANNFTFPTGSPLFLISSASDTFGTSGTASRSFTSYFNQNNVLNERVVGSQVLMFAPSPGNFSTSGTAPTLILNGTTVPYGLSNYTTITLSGSGTPSDQFTGKTTVNVPEPTSMALMLVGGSALAFRSRRRLKIAA